VRNHERIAHLLDAIELSNGDLLDQTSLVSALRQIRPHEIYNLAAQSFVPASFSQPVLTGEFNGLGVTRLLDAIRIVDPQIRFYQASSSEMFGNVATAPQNETTKFQPRSPYGVAKLYGHWITVNFRESYGLHAVSGILFNHESPRRGTEFVTRKITLTAARIAAGLQKTLRLGNLDSRRDWGYAGDYVEAMRLMLQQAAPRDYVIGTGESHSVREFVEEAFRVLDLDWKDHVVVDPDLARPADVDSLVADSARARAELGWKPAVDFPGSSDDGRVRRRAVAREATRDPGGAPSDGRRPLRAALTLRFSGNADDSGSAGESSSPADSGFIGSNLALRLVRDGALCDAMIEARRQLRERPGNPERSRDPRRGRSGRVRHGGAGRGPGGRLSPRGAGLPRHVSLQPVSRHRHQHQGDGGPARGLPQAQPGGHRRALGHPRAIRARRPPAGLRGRAVGSPRLYEISQLSAEMMPHVHPHSRRPHGSAAADECLRSARPDETPVFRRRELVRAARARRFASPDLRERRDPARFSLRR
jgi:GDPmannose 4,6-dehydratase